MRLALRLSRVWHGDQHIHGLVAARLGGVWMTWRQAMRSALYGPGGFYARGELPARHFRTSVHASPRYATALLALLAEVDAALGRPGRLDLVDVGAGGGELLGQVLAAAAPGLAGRLIPHAVEIAPRPPALDPRIRWCERPPAGITGLVIASEWLDNVPIDVAELTPAGPRLVLVDDATGAERRGHPPQPADLAWLDAWWPLRAAGGRAEIGRPRCEAWAGIIARMDRGVAVAADYGHRRAARPACGTLTGYLEGRAVPPVPDGSRDITAHVALDACAAAGTAAGAQATLLTTQRRVLRALGISGRRPPLTLADTDPAAYLTALCLASGEAELIDPVGLGGFGWLIQTVGVPLPQPLAPLARQGGRAGENGVAA
jgi:SAM-dependent MidA family methyltransferase